MKKRLAAVEGLRSALPAEIGEQILQRAKEQSEWRIEGFRDLYWEDNFDIPSAFELLISKDPNLISIQKIVYKGLCSYIIYPDNLNLRRQFMIGEIYRMLGRAEAKARKKMPINAIAVLILQYLAGPELLFAINSIFGNSGVYDKIFRPVSSKTSIDIIKRSERNVYVTCEFMKILHYQLEFGNKNSRFNKPSRNIAEFLLRNDGKFSKSKSKYLSEKAFRNYWSTQSKTSCLVYAACNVKLEDGSPIINDLIDGKFEFQQHRRFINELFSKAMFSAERILKLTDMNVVYRQNISNLPNVSIETIVAPVFPEDYAATVLGHFADRGARRG